MSEGEMKGKGKNEEKKVIQKKEEERDARTYSMNEHYRLGRTYTRDRVYWACRRIFLNCRPMVD